MRQRNFPIEVFRKRLQVHVRGVHVVVNIVKRFPRDVAVRHHHGFQPVRFRFFANIHNVFAPNRRLVVGERHGCAIVFSREQRNFFRQNGLRMNLIVARFGDVPVLAKKAAHVAAGGSHAEDARAGKKMIERFFFDRIDLQRRGRTVTEAEKFSAAIHADKTETGLPVMDAAMTRAKETVNARASAYLRIRF